VRAKYRKKPGERVTAVQLDLETGGFEYRKWGGLQVCKQGDWLVDNRGEVYTVDQQVFADTYRQVSEGRYEKTGAVWAEVAESAGSIRTKEGITHYEAGDYIVDNDEAGQDRYAVSRETFQSQYEAVDEPD
jgi:hypothetical protein